MLRTVMAIHGLECVMKVADAAGCNWVAMQDIMATHMISDILPKDLMSKYPDIDFDVKIVDKDDVTGEYFIFLPDMPHLTKNIVTALELSSSKFSKRSIKYGKCPIEMKMIEVVWLKTGGATGQFHETKLTVYHFEKNAYSRMNVSLATQVLSASVAKMIRDAIADDEIQLPIRKKEMYNHLADLCEKWNEVVDICNGKGGPHTPENAVERQVKLLSTLNWFSKWKKSHDAKVLSEDATEFNFFADETWFCIRALILAHVGAISIYCVLKRVSINPKKMNTDAVEWFFGDVRQFIPGSTNKVGAKGMGHGASKASACTNGRHLVHGNNKKAADALCRPKKH